MIDEKQGALGAAATTGVRPSAAIEAELEPWLSQTAAGDRRAFRRLYDATSPKLFAQALHIMRRRDAAEDVLQEAYVRIWTRARDFDPRRGRAWPWIGRILRNAAIDRLRRDRPLSQTQDIDDEAHQIAGPSDPIDTRIDLVRGLEQLSTEQRDAIVTVVVQGWTHDEAAQRDGTPTPTNKARVARGLRRLKTLQQEDRIDRFDD